VLENVDYVSGSRKEKNQAIEVHRVSRSRLRAENGIVNVIPVAAITQYAKTIQQDEGGEGGKRGYFLVDYSEGCLLLRKRSTRDHVY